MPQSTTRRPTVTRRILGALLWGGLSLLVGGAVTVGAIVFVGATHSPYSHVEDRQPFPIHLVMAVMGMVFGALPEQK